MRFTAIIPARFASTRLPGKPLVDIDGKPMIIHVMTRARESGAARVIVATEHPDVAKVVEQAGGEVCITRSDHHSGTERIAEVIERYHFPDDEIIVNIQGDEPLIPPVIIQQLAENINACSVGMATLAVPLDEPADAFNPNVVKVVRDARHFALYFSRATIPWDRERFSTTKDITGYPFLRHIGIYAYRAEFIRRYVSWPASQLEQVELLEQLRVLWYGEKIHVDVAKEAPVAGVDTTEDLVRVRALISSQPR